MTTHETKRKVAATETKQQDPAQEDLKVAYEIHTLAQMIYGQLAMAPPWGTPVNPMAGMQAPPAWTPPTPADPVQAWGRAPVWPY